MGWRVALASCARWPTGVGDHAGLAEALAAKGAHAEWVPWDDPATDWASYDLVLLRATWDYPAKLASFLGWVDRLSAVTTVENPAPVVHWNHHKRYLQDLAAAGVPTVPTTVVTASEPDAHASLLARGIGEVVLKPAIGIAGDGVVRGRGDDPAVEEHLRWLLAGGDALVQPYLRAIENTGETSIVLLGGRVTYAVAKRPTSGEFRVHEHRGGSYQPAEPRAEQVDVALAACDVARARTGATLLYARVDLVADDDGDPLVMELELIEPSLYLHTVPAGVETFADTVVRTLPPSSR